MNTFIKQELNFLTRIFRQMRDFLLIIFVLGTVSLCCWTGHSISNVCSAEGMIDDKVTFGPDNYLENSINFSVDLTDNLYSSIGYSFSKDENSNDISRNYLLGLGNNFTDNFSIQMNYSFSPKVEGYKYNAIGANISCSDQRGGINNDDFKTTLFVDFSHANHSADIYIDTTTLAGHKIHIDTNWSLEQNFWTFGLAEAFYRNSILSFNYISFSYDKDIKNPQFQKTLDFVLILGGVFNMKLPGVLFSISSFPLNSWNISLTQYFSDFFSLSFDCNRLINYINNSKVFYYSLDSRWYLTDRWQLNLGYTLYVDEDKNEFSYYSSGIGFMF